MDLLDVIVVFSAISAAVGGWRLGFVARVTSWLGLALGLVIAARFLPTTVNAMRNSATTSQLLVVAGLLVGGAFVGQALGLLLGAQFHRLPLGPFRMADRGLGAIAGVVGVLVALWAMVPALAGAPGWPARQARGSVLARTLDRHAPRPPDTLQALRRLVGQGLGPEVFSGLGRSRRVGPPPAASGIAADVVTRVSGATVKVSGVACHRLQEGSGFAAGPDLIVTNAHVVAGERRTDVSRLDGTQLPATVVLFDADRDLALLRVRGLGQVPLDLGTGKRGDTGAVFGHPGGSDELMAAPASVSDEVTAEGRDLYDSHGTRRDVFILASQLHPGDSGGALVNTAGVVIGVAFAIAPDRPGTAYALTSAEVRPVLAAPANRAVSTGQCLTSA